MVVVHYYSGEATRQVLETLRQQARAAGLDVEAVVVDHGGTSQDRSALGSLGACRVLTPPENGGFAKGVNAGVEASAGDPLLIANPDVGLAPGCLEALLASIRDGAGVAGPRFYWDPERRFILPPAEARDWTSEILRSLAERSEAWAQRARGRWRRHARRHWRAVTALPSSALSGALLMIDRAAWDRVGPFDERFRLYFEETDWLRRAAREGIRPIYEPRAIAFHEVGGSTRREPRAQGWFEASAAHFRRKHFGTLGARLLERIARTNQDWEPAAADETPLLTDSPSWLEVSPSRAGFPAAAERLDGRIRDLRAWDPGPRLTRALEAEGQCLWLRVVDDEGRESRPRRLTRSSVGSPA